MEELLRALWLICTPDFWRMAVFWTLSLISSYFQLLAGAVLGGKSKSFSHSKSHFFNSDRRPVCIVTGVIIYYNFACYVSSMTSLQAVVFSLISILMGLYWWQATSGLGAAASHALAREGFFVVMVGRSNHMLSKVMMEIIKENENAQLKCFEADMSSFSSILTFKESLEQWLMDMDMDPSVQLLINNAGVLAKTYRSTADGLDEMIATNYVGAFCLTNLLLPLLTRSCVPARIVNLTSFTHRNVSSMQVDKESVAGKCFSKLSEYPFSHVYEYSKLCLLLFTYELHRQLSLKEETSHVSVVAADPGAVKTNIMREIPPYLSHFAFLALKLLGLLQHPKDGVRSILDAALAPPEASGVYFFGGKGNTLSSSALSYNTSLAERLWKDSSNLLMDLKRASIGTSSSESNS